MSELTDDELKEAGLLARVRVDYAAAGCTPGSAMGRRLAAAAERRAVYDTGHGDGYRAGLHDARAGKRLVRRDRVDWIRSHEAARLVADRTGAPMDAVEAALAELHERITAPLSCGCPPEHHDEAIRRAADPAERRALLQRLTQQSLELGTYDRRVTPTDRTEES